MIGQLSIESMRGGTVSQLQNQCRLRLGYCRGRKDMVSHRSIDN